MPLYCSRETFEALNGLNFPADKPRILTHALNGNAPEAVIVAINRLQDNVVFRDIASVCENVSIVCSLEVYQALQGIKFPATKKEILDFASSNAASTAALMALRDLAEGYQYASIAEVCSNVTAEESTHLSSK